MINAALIAAGLLPQGIDKSKKQDGFDYRTILKVGDTVEDIKEGQSVGATTVAVSSGTQTIDTLVKAQPIVVLPNVAAVPLYLKNHGYLA
jgi:phosphoglycolate phosphatase-like HAD superfamily hydrolase